MTKLANDFKSIGNYGTDGKDIKLLVLDIDGTIAGHSNTHQSSC